MDENESWQDDDSLAPAVEARDNRTPENGGEHAPSQTGPSNNLTLKAHPSGSASDTDDLPAVQVPDFAAIVTPLKKRCAAWVNANIRQDKIFRRLLFEAARQVVPHARTHGVEFGAFCGPEITGTTEAKVIRLLFGEQHRANVRNWSYVLAWWADRPEETRDPRGITQNDIIDDQKAKRDAERPACSKPVRISGDVIAAAAISPAIVIRDPQSDQTPATNTGERTFVLVVREFPTGRWELYACADDHKLTRTAIAQAKKAEVRAPRLATWDKSVPMHITLPQQSSDRAPRPTPGKTKIRAANGQPIMTIPLKDPTDEQVREAVRNMGSP